MSQYVFSGHPCFTDTPRTTPMERVPQAVKKAGGTQIWGRYQWYGRKSSFLFSLKKEVMDIINGLFSHNQMIYTMYHFTHYDFIYIYTLFLAMVYIIYMYILCINVISSRYIIDNPMVLTWMPIPCQCYRGSELFSCKMIPMNLRLSWPMDGSSDLWIYHLFGGWF